MSGLPVTHLIFLVLLLWKVVPPPQQEVRVAQNTQNSPKTERKINSLGKQQALP
jgi:hypothetical protein